MYNADYFGSFHDLEGSWMDPGEFEMDCGYQDGALQENFCDQTPLPEEWSSFAPTEDPWEFQQQRAEFMQEEEAGPSSEFRACEVPELSFLDQFLAVVERVFRQCLRTKLGLLLEVGIPILFFCITVFLWSLWGTEKFAETNFVNYSHMQSFIDADFYLFYVCSRTPGGVHGLPPCNPVVPLDCKGDESTLPVKGLCVHASVGTSLLLHAFLNSFNGRIAELPTLDAIVVFQWLARKSFKMDSSPFGIYPKTRFSAITSSGMLYFVGDPTFLRGLTAEFEKSSKFFNYVNGGIYNTMKEAERQFERNPFNWGIVHVRRADRHALDAIIYLNATAVPDFDEIVSDAYPGGFQFDRAEMYVLSGYLTLQKLISEYYINQLSPTLRLNTTAYIASQAFVEYRQATFLMNARDILPLIFVLAFLYSVSTRTKAIVLEKEMRIREAMLIMGMKDVVIYAVWLVRSVSIDFFVCIVISILLKCTYMTQSDPFIIFCVFFLFTLTTIPLSGLLSAFFSKARLASLLSPIIYFILTLPTMATSETNSALTIIFALLSPSAFVTILKHILADEFARGFSAKNLADSLYEPKTVVVLCVMLVDFFIYFILMLYLDAVIPKDWGTNKHPFFFIIDPIRWYFSKGDVYEGGGPDGRAPDGVFEHDEEEEEGIVVRICGLRKVYRRGGKRFTAVQNLYWNLREGEISVLLGRNGAGKSTTLNMMTGMVRPDGGDCYVYGLSVRRQLSRVRREIGFCPQHNILWPELTCREHLEFFAKIKGLKGAELEKAVQRMLHETDMLEKIDFPAMRLSGGQMRKLSLGLAFVGQSRLVFLDEPTAGMDVGARRHIWELLRRMSSFHTILLTTHYMDEADLLGHRIGIMKNGSLQCSGSSLFLKSRLGLGYSLTIAMVPDGDFDSIHQIVEENIPNVLFLGYSGFHLSYCLPMSEASNFSELLYSIEGHANYGVCGYSISAATLEDVFLRVSQGLDEIRMHDEDYSFLWNCALTRSPALRQFCVLMMKRFQNAFRDRRMQCFQLVCPFFCVLLAMLLGLVSFKKNQELNLSFDLYNEKVLLDTAQCEDFWGQKPLLSNVLVNETHFGNAVELGSYTSDTWFSHEMPRYASISCIDRDLYWKMGKINPIIMLHNTSAIHQTGVTMAAFYQLLYKNISSGRGNISWSIGALRGGVDSLSSIEVILMGTILMIPFTFFPSNPVAWVVKERECGALQLQKIAGLRLMIYWLSNFLFDMAVYLVSVIFVVIIFAVFRRDEYVGPDTVGALFTLFFVYGLTSTIAGYLVSFFFSEHSTAQMVVMAAGFVLGFLLLMVVFIFSLLEKTKDLSDHLRWPFRILPTYSIGECMINLSNFRQMKMRGLANSAFDGNITGYPILFLAVEFPIFLLLLLFIEHPKRRRYWSRHFYSVQRSTNQEIPDQDTDVEEERNAVYMAKQMGIVNSVVTVCGLHKKYSNGKVAVRNLTFGVLPGEIFGFLGTNGAGKTTTIAMLCQQLLPTSGSAAICGHDILEESSEALKCIGYCPQFDACLELLTVEEQLQLYAGVHGIVRRQCDNIVFGLLQLCELVEYRDTLAHELSGGNRRKLSVAIALVGGPRVLFLDEPSAGMDPIARRGLWNAIEAVSDNCSVVLTTHHLEEVEVLAHRVAIMVDGTLRCIGDQTHLKNKFGSGYEMSIRIESAELYEPIVNFVTEMFPNATLNEFKGQRFVYTLPRDASISDTFRILRDNKELLGITDYSVSQTSIEQVFLRVIGEIEPDF
ncbi:ATP-binding cassette transporter ABCA1, putative [Trypanosoma cruzi]|nr:ATP-binding cassette transporter ABCA1, putative [Trypanosoma cruzi]